MSVPTATIHGGLRARGRHRPTFALSRRKLMGYAGTAATLVAVAAWWLFLAPQLLGGPAAYVMVSGTSMEPTLRGGDFVLARRPDRYKIGDIVAYRIPKEEVGAGAIVIHRIVGGSAERGFMIKGDNKTGPDVWRPTPRDLVGTAWFRVPHAGIVLQRLHAPVPLAFFAGLLTFLIIAPGPMRRRPREVVPEEVVPEEIGWPELVPAEPAPAVEWLELVPAFPVPPEVARADVGWPELVPVEPAPAEVAPAEGGWPELVPTFPVPPEVTPTEGWPELVPAFPVPPEVARTALESIERSEELVAHRAPAASLEARSGELDSAERWRPGLGTALVMLAAVIALRSRETGA